MPLQNLIDRRGALKAIAATGAVAALPGCAATVATAPPPPSELGPVLDAMAERLLALGPEGATALGIDTGARAPLRSQLTDRSRAGQDRIAATLRADLARLDALAPDSIPDAHRIDVEVVQAAYRSALDGFAQPYGDVAVGGWRNSPYVVCQNVGAYLDVPRFLDSDHPVRDAADAEAYLARLESFPRQLDGELGRVRAAAGKGLIAPDFVIDKTLEQLRRSLAEARSDDTQLAGALTRRTAAIPGDWAARARRIAQEMVAPALERQIAEFATQRPKARADAGMGAQPGGDAYYAWALRAGTTTARTPDEIHALGLEELEALHARMEPLLRGLGYTTGTVGARMKALGDDPRFAFAEGDPGRAQIMAFIDERLKWIKAQMPRAFATQVPGNVEVRRLPLSEEPGAPSAYGGAGSIDGKIPGKFWINLRTTSLHNRFSLPTLTHHEAIPGHVWQGEYANRLPLIRTLLGFNAYSEGWALYAQQLADELGAYEGDPVGQLGYLQSIAFRACRMVVDTGLHAKRWTRAQAVAFFVERNGSNPEDVASEVDRYCTWPGQACGYKMGHGEIVRQRARAQGALGSRYDLRTFDDAVVKGGNVPLSVLAKVIDRYVAGAAA